MSRDTISTQPRREVKIGSLFSGYGGLDMGVISALDNLNLHAEVAWHVEYDEAPSRILAHHWPDVPNYGDITAVDWETVERVDGLTGGFPCQDVSLAGARAGLMSGTRSGLWSHFAAAIAALHPSWVLIENVRGLLSAKAGDPEEITDDEIVGDLELGAWPLGELGGSDRPVLRALGAVLGDLANLGYDAVWAGIRASDAGAPHARFRVFILGWPSDATREGRTWGHLPTEQAAEHGQPSDARRSTAENADKPTSSQRRIAASRQAESRRAWANAGRRGGASTSDPSDGAADGQRTREELGLRGERAATDPHQDERVGEQEQQSRRPATARRGRESATDPERGGQPGRARASQRGSQRGASAERDSEGIAPHAAADSGGNEPERRGTAGNVAGSPRAGEGDREKRQRDGNAAPDRFDTPGAWGPYEPAVRRWEQLTRPAPAPTRPDGKGGTHRLSPLLPEWMMGLPAGHVTDPGIWAGMSYSAARNAQIKACGNGVVPQQAALAFTVLLEMRAKLIEPTAA